MVNGSPRENIESPPRDFPREKPKGNPEGDLQYSPEGVHEYFPLGFIHHDTPKPKAFSQIFILTMYWTSSRARADTAHAPVWPKASCQAEHQARLFLSV